MDKLIAEVGDTISWTFDDAPTESEMFRGKTFSAEVAMVDVEERHYGVYAEYGQDLIPFDHATIQRTNNPNKVIKHVDITEKAFKIALNDYNKINSDKHFSTDNFIKWLLE